MSVTKKKISVASFRMTDIDAAQMKRAIAGIALVVAGAASALAGVAYNAAVSDAKGAARLVLIASSHASAGAATFNTGGGHKLSAAMMAGSHAAAAMGDASSNSLALSLSPSLKAAANNAGAAWQATSNSLSSLTSNIAAANELGDAISRSVPAMSAIIKRIEQLGRPAHLQRALDSIYRVLGSSESGVSAANSARVAADVAAMLREVAVPDFRAEAALLEPLAVILKAPQPKAISQDQLRSVYDSAEQAKSGADALGAAAYAANAGLIIIGLGLLVAMVGIFVTVGAFKGVATDFGKRYSKAMQQFRSDEAAIQSMTRQVNALREAEHVAGQIEVDAEGDVARLAEGLNDFVMSLEQRQSEVRAGLSKGLVTAGACDEGAIRLAAAASKSTNSAVDASRAIQACAEGMKTAVADAMSLNASAVGAVEHAADTTRVVKEAVGHLNSIRDGLQDAMKRIKRVGERSQEIHSVVETFELLSEQVAVLALNAALEAERAGEAGGGFRMVAREVQALAVRSRESVERVSGLVQAVQADVRSANEAVDRSTTQVVAGANSGAASSAMASSLAPMMESIRTMAASLLEAANGVAQKADAAAELNETALSTAKVAAHEAGEFRQPIKTLMRALEGAIGNRQGIA